MSDLPNQTETQMLRDLMNALPIIATRVGYRTDSTEEERSIADAALEAHRAWLDKHGGF